MVSSLNLFLMISGSLYILIILFALFYYFSAMSRKKNVLQIKNLEEDFEEPFVSIIVPTYNEERNIAVCLQSLKNLNYSNYEIIVSDGGSTDRTIEIAEALVDKVIIDKNVPRGWIGKNWGCHLGYKAAAKGDYLLFVDADTEHTPDSLRYFVRMSMERDAALLSVFPYQRLKNWWEAINPLFYFASNLTVGGTNSVNDPSKPNSHTASGQYMLFQRKDYEAIGGHEHIKGSIVEDLAFSRVVKIKTGRLFFINGTKLVYTRMYPDSPKQCYEGWKKCLFPGTKLTQPRRITGALMWILWGLLSPVAIVLSALYSPEWYYLLITSLLHVMSVSAFFIFWNKKGTHLLIAYLFFPLVNLAFCIMLLISALELVIKKKTTWRGREYEPDLFVASLYEKQEVLVGETNRMPQLDTDVEVELDDKIISESFGGFRLPKAGTAPKVQGTTFHGKPLPLHQVITYQQLQQQQQQQQIEQNQSRQLKH